MGTVSSAEIWRKDCVSPSEQASLFTTSPGTGQSPVESVLEQPAGIRRGTFISYSVGGAQFARSKEAVFALTVVPASLGLFGTGGLCIYPETYNLPLPCWASAILAPEGRRVHCACVCVSVSV